MCLQKQKFFTRPSLKIFYVIFVCFGLVIFTSHSPCRVNKEKLLTATLLCVLNYKLNIAFWYKTESVGLKWFTSLGLTDSSKFAAKIFHSTEFSFLVFSSSFFNLMHESHVVFLFSFLCVYGEVGGITAQASRAACLIWVYILQIDKYTNGKWIPDYIFLWSSVSKLESWYFSVGKCLKRTDCQSM